MNGPALSAHRKSASPIVPRTAIALELLAIPLLDPAAFVSSKRAVKFDKPVALLLIDVLRHGRLKMVQGFVPFARHRVERFELSHLNFWPWPALHTPSRRDASRRGWAKAPAESIAVYERAFRQEMAFEREFVAQGGLLLAGCDPTGIGNAPAGFGDQRQMELLIEAGFSPAEAVRIYTLNGARYLGREESIGSIATGKQADLLLLDGEFASDASAIRRPVVVFKEGRAWDPAKLKASVEGWAGVR